MKGIPNYYTYCPFHPLVVASLESEANDNGIAVQAAAQIKATEPKTQKKEKPTATPIPKVCWPILLISKTQGKPARMPEVNGIGEVRGWVGC